MKWLIDEKADLINMSFVEKIYVSDNFKITGVSNPKGNSYNHTTCRKYDICVITTSGAVFFIGKITIYYTEIHKEYEILESLFKSIIASDEQFIDFNLIAQNIIEKFEGN